MGGPFGGEGGEKFADGGVFGAEGGGVFAVEEEADLGEPGAGAGALDAEPAQAEKRGGGREDAEKDDYPGLEVGGGGEGEQRIPAEEEEGAEHQTPESEGGAVPAAEKFRHEARKAEGDEVQREAPEGEGAAGPGPGGVADEAKGEARAAFVKEARAGVEAERVERGGVGGDSGGGGLGTLGIAAVEVVEGVGDLLAEAEGGEARVIYDL